MVTHVITNGHLALLTLYRDHTLSHMTYSRTVLLAANLPCMISYLHICTCALVIIVSC